MELLGISPGICIALSLVVGEQALGLKANHWLLRVLLDSIREHRKELDVGKQRDVEVHSGSTDVVVELWLRAVGVGQVNHEVHFLGLEHLHHLAGLHVHRISTAWVFDFLREQNESKQFDIPVNRKIQNEPP